ncbi:MAG: PLDc N-terminal domain-containing protein [Desulfuromonadales bacterium]|jgi:hypothetical protein
MKIILGIALLVADVLVILKILQGPATTGKKVAWIFVIFFLPFLGLIIWFFLGTRSLQA